MGAAQRNPSGLTGYGLTASTHPARLSRGFTLFELVVVICILAVLMGTFLNRVLFYQEQAEKAAMVRVVLAVQNALVMQQGRLMTHGNESGIATLKTENPMNWMAEKPGNYAGEFFDPAPGVIAPGKWAFDLKARELIYVPDHTRHFVPGKGGNQWIRYRVYLTYDPAHGSGGKGSSELAGVLFQPTQAYQWAD